MITVHKADLFIKHNTVEFPICIRAFDQTLGLVLEENIFADRDFPAFDKSLMDGIAIRKSAYQKGVRKFRIVGTQPAGVKAKSIKNDDECIEIMTGAVVANGSDCIIPVEQYIYKNGDAIISQSLEVQSLNYIRYRGSDYKFKDLILAKGTILGPPQISVLASVGKSRVKVRSKPRCAIISTGDEIVDVQSKIKSYQSRKSNSNFVQCALDKTRLIDSDSFHCPDNFNKILALTKKSLKNYDSVIFIGGVSKGKYDFIPKVLEFLKVKTIFHTVAQKPGHPLLFAMTRRRKAIFALPGNPQSTQVCTYRYVIPYFKKCIGINEKSENIKVNKNIIGLKNKTHYALVKKIITQDGTTYAKLINSGGSGDVLSSGKSDGFIEIPPLKTLLTNNTIVKYYEW